MKFQVILQEFYCFSTDFNSILSTIYLTNITNFHSEMKSKKASCFRQLHFSLTTFLIWFPISSSPLTTSFVAGRSCVFGSNKTLRSRRPIKHRAGSQFRKHLEYVKFQVKKKSKVIKCARMLEKLENKSGLLNQNSFEI